MNIRVATLVALAVVGIAALACSEQDIAGLNEAASDESSGLGLRQSGTIDIFDLRTGHCFRDPGIEVETIESFEVELFSCDDRRAEITVSSLVYMERDGNYPGETYFDDVFLRECSLLDSFYFFPSPESWDFGDRTISCLRELD